MPLGIEVIEIVTGFVQSNILHHGLYAPESSLYLPIKCTVEAIKYRGNEGGKSPHAYATSVVEKLMRPKPSIEIWEGSFASLIRFLVTFIPLWLLVSHFHFGWYAIRPSLNHLTELDPLPPVQA